MGRYSQEGYDLGPIVAGRVEVDTSTFSGNLSLLDDDVQTALETLDGHTHQLAFNDLSDMPGGDATFGDIIVTAGVLTAQGNTETENAIVLKAGRRLVFDG